ncbi:MAG: chemotaxis protein CheW [Leptolyngbyaceae cyanobacterium]
MPNTLVLTFKLHNRCYGIDAHAVREVFFLPAIQSITARSVANGNATMIGVINLRGHFVPVMDLSYYLGDGPHTYTLSDSVIVLGMGDRQIGIVVSQVLEVITLETAVCSVDDSCEVVAPAIRRDLVANLAQYNSDIIIHLNSTVLMDSLRRGELALGPRPEDPETPESLNENAKDNLNGNLNGNLNETEESVPLEFFPNATEEEEQCLYERACALMQQTEEDGEESDRVSVAILDIHGERLALPVEYIREFTPIRDVTPIPCCPAHIIGNMNLRGEILTLIDIQQAIKLHRDSPDTLSRAVVVQVENIITGITVDAVFDVISFKPSDLAPVPVGAHTGHEDYLRGVIPYHKAQVSVLNLAHLLQSDELIVNAQ